MLGGEGCSKQETNDLDNVDPPTHGKRKQPMSKDEKKVVAPG